MTIVNCECLVNSKTKKLINLKTDKKKRGDVCERLPVFFVLYFFGVFSSVATRKS